MLIEINANNANHNRPCKRMGWTAVFAGERSVEAVEKLYKTSIF
jgi:hypothetical protein